MSASAYHEYAAEEYVVRAEPFYLPVGNEVSVFQAAYEEDRPSESERWQSGRLRWAIPRAGVMAFGGGSE